MKIKIFTVALLVAVLGFTVFDAYLLQKQLAELRDEAINLNVSEENKSALSEAKALRERFMRKERFISLTVNHEDLTNIESAFTELIGELSVEEHKNAEVAKNRLIDALEHLGRLSGCNFDAII